MNSDWQLGVEASCSRRPTGRLWAFGDQTQNLFDNKTIFLHSHMKMRNKQRTKGLETRKEAQASRGAGTHAPDSTWMERVEVLYWKVATSGMASVTSKLFSSSRSTSSGCSNITSMGSARSWGAGGQRSKVKHMRNPV